ncbi:MAG TPA: hypothetical protein VFG30_11015 [Polyangiales bacterium]|nr:hypothetical protein [Polyangiales bacterium]
MFQRRLLLQDPQLATVAARCFEQLLGAVAAIAPKPGKSGGRKQNELVASAVGPSCTLNQPRARKPESEHGAG